MATTALLDDLNPASIARLRVERLLTHFRRFLAPDDATLRTERLAVPDILAHR